MGVLRAQLRNLRCLRFGLRLVARGPVLVLHHQADQTGHRIGLARGPVAHIERPFHEQSIEQGEQVIPGPTRLQFPAQHIGAQRPLRQVEPLHLQGADNIHQVVEQRPHPVREARVRLQHGSQAILHVANVGDTERGSRRPRLVDNGLHGLISLMGMGPPVVPSHCSTFTPLMERVFYAALSCGKLMRAPGP